MFPSTRCASSWRCARPPIVRLFASVPWLEGDLVRAVERYASQIAIDTEAITEVARSVDPSDPESVESALSGGVFALATTPDQRRALTRLETMLALIEGWVEVVTRAPRCPTCPTRMRCAR